MTFGGSGNRRKLESICLGPPRLSRRTPLPMPRLTTTFDGRSSFAKRRVEGSPKYTYGDYGFVGSSAAKRELPGIGDHAASQATKRRKTANETDMSHTGKFRPRGKSGGPGASEQISATCIALHTEVSRNDLSRRSIVRLRYAGCTVITQDFRSFTVVSSI